MRQPRMATHLQHKLLQFLFLAIASASALAESNNKIQFYGIPPQNAAILGTMWRIYADGEIDIDAGDRLAEYVRENNIPAHSLIALNSPGGNLVGGMKLGKAIRAAGLSSYIGKRPKSSTGLNDPGECYSACTLAFIGGEYRFATKGSVYGVHRFYSSIHSPEDSDVAQIMSAAVVQYIRDMDVDSRLFSLMTEVGSKEITIVPESEMVRLNIINKGRKSTQWTMESISQGVYLKGQRETYYGINKFMLSCLPHERLLLMIIFDPQGRGDDVVKYFKKDSLVIDDKAIPIDPFQVSPSELINGWVNASYVLNNDLVEQLKNAQTVGITFQMAYSAPVFLGFDDMNFSEGAKKLPGLITTCRGE
jgi:hypothetical protein